MRIGVFPLFLFSGTFFPVSQLPDWLQPLALLSPLYHSVELCRMATTGTFDAADAVGSVAALLCSSVPGASGVSAPSTGSSRSDDDAAVGARAAPRPRRPPWFMPGTLVRRPLRVVERNTIVYRRGWLVFLSGLVEPFLYLLSIGIGVGALVGKVPGPNGVPVEYDAFVAPGLMAAAAMNGAVLDTTFNFFIKLKYSHTYDAMLATPLGVRDVAVGEVLSALLRGAFYSTAFLVAMVAFGLVSSWWAVLAVPAAMLIAFAFAGAGLGLTTFMRSWVDFDYVNLALVPMFLFSATFFPLSRYPEALQVVVKVTPLYQGVALLRGLTLGVVSWTMLLNVLYLAVMGVIGVRVATNASPASCNPEERERKALAATSTARVTKP